MDIREKVARAICEIEGYFPWGHLGDAQKYGVHKTAIAAITVFLEAAAEDGWHMRPDEATEEMIRNAFGTDGAQGWRKTAYRAMLAVAPEFEWNKKTSTKPGKPPSGRI